MTLRLTLAAALLSLVALAQTSQAGGFGRFAGNGYNNGNGYGYNARVYRAARENPALLNWHGNYYHTAYGAPLALVVPPTAFTHTEFGWGVGNKRVSPIYPQFGREFPGYYYGGQGFLPTPHWPSDTEQFGVHYVRGPW